VTPVSASSILALGTNFLTLYGAPVSYSRGMVLTDSTPALGASSLSSNLSAPTKFCKACGLDLPHTEYHKSSRRGIQARCKKCVSVNSRKAYLAGLLRMPESKRCQACGLVKTAKDFHTGSRRDGLKEECRSCIRWTRLAYTYGIDKSRFEEMMTAQGGKCRICSTDLTDPVVDHDHGTGLVRGILCHACNKGLGHFRDSAVLLESALNFIRACSLKQDESL
jgi:hypothetical protein